MILCQKQARNGRHREALQATSTVGHKEGSRETVGGYLAASWWLQALVDKQ